MKSRSRELLETARFSRDLAGLLSLGYPSLEAVQKLLPHQIPSLERPLLGVVESLRRGHSLSSSVSGENFEPLFRRLVISAEAGECLPSGLEAAAATLENVAERRLRCFQGVLYPAVLTSFIFVLCWLLLLGVGHLLSQLFQAMMTSLPLPTRVLLSLSDLASHPLGFLLFFLPVALLWYFALGRGPVVAWRYKVPIFGGWLQREEAALYLQTLGCLTSLGTPLVEAAEVSAGVVAYPLQKPLLRVADALRRGDRLSQALSATKLFPPLALWTLAHREESGELPLEQIGRLIDRKLEVSIGTGLIIFEPLALIGVGIAIGFIVLGILMPVYQLLESL